MAAFRRLAGVLLLLSLGSGTGWAAVAGHPGWRDQDIEDKLSEIRASAGESREAYRYLLIGHILEGLRFNKEMDTSDREHVSSKLAAMMAQAPASVLQGVAACRPRFQMVPYDAVPSQVEAVAELPEKDRRWVDNSYTRVAPDGGEIAGLAYTSSGFPKLVLVRQRYVATDTLIHEWAHVMHHCGGGMLTRVVAAEYHFERKAADLPFYTPYAETNGSENVAEAAEGWFSRSRQQESSQWLRANDPKLYLLMWRIFGPPGAVSQ